MSLDHKNPTKLGREKILKKGQFVDFTIEREDWNKYRISDGSLLRARVILSNCLLGMTIEETLKELKPKEKLNLELVFHPRTIFVVEAPSELRGTPDGKSYSSEELNKSIIEKDMDFETEKQVWNLYTLENGVILKFRLSVDSVNKTSKFESGGMPIYTINSTVEVKIELPKNVQKMLDKKGRKI